MKKYLTVILSLLLLFSTTSCKNETNNTEINSATHDETTLLIDSNETESITDTESEKDVMKSNYIYIKVGENTLTAVLEDNESAHALKELLTDGPKTISASNYGGFEKVCSLGVALPRNDSQTTTKPGDICLYNGNQIVIFYGSNSWAYTKLGKVENKNAKELKNILSGEETEITISISQ